MAPSSFLTISTSLGRNWNLRNLQLWDIEFDDNEIWESKIEIGDSTLKIEKLQFEKLKF